MARLFRSQKIPGATKLQITHGDLKAGAKLRKFLDGSQPFFRDLSKRLIFFIH